MPPTLSTAGTYLPTLEISVEISVKALLVESCDGCVGLLLVVPANSTSLPMSCCGRGERERYPIARRDWATSDGNVGRDAHMMPTLS